jgi:hypothetical protein
MHGISFLLFNTFPAVYHLLPSYIHPIAAVITATVRRLSFPVCTTSKVTAASFRSEQLNLHWMAQGYCIALYSSFRTLSICSSQHPDQQNAQYCSLDIYITVSHWTFLHASISKGSSWGNQIKTTSQKKNYKLWQTAERCEKVKQLKCRRLFLVVQVQWALVYSLRDTRRNCLHFNANFFTPFYRIHRVPVFLCRVALIWFRDDDPLGIEGRRNVQCATVICISKEGYCAFFWCGCCELVTA